MIYQAHGEATYSNGPHNPPLEHVRKRRRISPQNRTPEIHVHVTNPNPPPSMPPPPSITPTHVHTPILDIIDLTDLPTSDEEDNDDILYPRIEELLSQLDQRYPGVNYMQYHQRMLEFGFSRINQIRESQRTRNILLHLEIPLVVIDQIILRARRLQRRCEKQCADSVAIKMEID